MFSRKETPMLISWLHWVMSVVGYFLAGSLRDFWMNRCKLLNLFFVDFLLFFSFPILLLRYRYMSDRHKIRGSKSLR